MSIEPYIKQVTLHIFLNILVHVTLIIYWSEIDQVLNVNFNYMIYIFLLFGLYQILWTRETWLQCVSFVHQAMNMSM